MCDFVDTLPTADISMPYYWNDPNFTLSIYFKNFMYDEVKCMD
jgi:hypothetical protein